MVTLAPSSTPRVGDSAIEKIEVKLTHYKKKKERKKMKIQLHALYFLRLYVRSSCNVDR